MGKTLFLKDLAQKYLDWTFLFILPATIEKPEHIYNVFNFAFENSPTVIVFEDIDTLAQNRDLQSNNFSPYLGAILNCLD